MKYLVILVGFWISFAAAQNDRAFLDSPYSNLIHPTVILDKSTPSRNDILWMIEHQSSVRSQEHRGTCSIFSATALFEYMQILEGTASSSINLSEEWLNYIAKASWGSNEGSTSSTNFKQIGRYGMAAESDWNYVGMTWKTLDDSPLAKKRCGHLSQQSQITACLFAHRDTRLLSLPDSVLEDENSDSYDPEFKLIRAAALKGKQDSWGWSTPYFNVRTTNIVKTLLNNRIAVTLDLDFYYGAWNHRKSIELGILKERNMENWYNGVVGFPEAGSIDVENSKKEPAGHSIVVVGYNDLKKITVTIPMKDGTEKTVTYTGVYYFKNSWGTDGFGRDFEIDGKSFSGYGMIPQAYAHRYGAFYRIPSKNN